MPSYTVIPQSTYDKTNSQAILKYVRSVSVTNKRTGIEYFRRLLTFEEFIKENYNFSVDELTINKVFSIDIYDLLSSYVSWLSERVSKKDGFKLSNTSIKNRVINVKNFLEFFDIDINPRKFKLKVKIPRVFNQYKEALTKDDIIKILEACESYKLKTYLILLASTGMRANEACSIRLKDIDFEDSKINIRAEFTKTKVGRYCFMTSELKEYLKTWIEYKYRRRRLYLDNIGNRWVTPNRRGEDLVFSSSFTYDGSVISVSQKQKKITELDIVSNLYTTLVVEYNKVIKQLNIEYEGDNKRRHIFTLHSFRRYVRTLISDLGWQDFAIWTIGHIGSTYWRKSEKEKSALFKKIEPSLLLLDQSSLNRIHADTQSRLETVEEENRDLKQNINKIMEMIQQNPKLSQVKPEALVKKKGL